MTRSDDLRALAQRIADALPIGVAQEIVLTGSVARGAADEASDIEMLVVTHDALELPRCLALAERAGLDRLGTWGPRDGVAQRVSGYTGSVPIELVWWPRSFVDTRIDAVYAGADQSTADALAHGVPLRTVGLLADWQERLGEYPSELAAVRVEDAALPWGGFAAAGVLTLLRPGDVLALTEWLVDAAKRVVTIVFALNRVWQPTSKRLAQRLAPLALRPERLADRIDEALTDPDPRRALLVMTELQLEAVFLAPNGPNVHRARTWLTEVAELLRR